MAYGADRASSTAVDDTVVAFPLDDGKATVTLLLSVPFDAADPSSMVASLPEGDADVVEKDSPFLAGDAAVEPCEAVAVRFKRVGHDVYSLVILLQVT